MDAIFKQVTKWFTGTKSEQRDPLSDSLNKQHKTARRIDVPVISILPAKKRVQLYATVRFKILTHDGNYDNVEFDLSELPNTKIIQAFDKVTGTIVLKFNQVSKNKDDMQRFYVCVGNCCASTAITVSIFDLLWKNHPKKGKSPCDSIRFPKQCAARMGVALEKSNITIKDGNIKRCASTDSVFSFHDDGIVKGHILVAQQLADWLNKKTPGFGEKQIFLTPTTTHSIDNKTGIVYIKDFWIKSLNNQDHIDVWDGKKMGNGDINTIIQDIKESELWFWEIY